MYQGNKRDFSKNKDYIALVELTKKLTPDEITKVKIFVEKLKNQRKL